MLLLAHLFAAGNWRVSLINVVIAPGIVNAVIAYALLHAMTGGTLSLRLHSPLEVSLDLSIGGLMIIVITGVIAYATTRHAYRKKQLRPLPEQHHRALRQYAGKAFKSELLLWLLGFAMLHMLLVLGVNRDGLLHTLTGQDFAVLKMIQALILSLMSASLGAAIASRHFHLRGAVHTT